MRIAIPQIYCGIADLQMDPFVKAGEFRRSLFTNMLFYGDLVITDGFWFMSESIARELRRKPEDNLLLAGLASGHIKPWFRKKVEGSFHNAYETIVAQGIVGLVEGSKSIALTLQKVADEAPYYRYGHWPKRLVGKSFYQEIKEDLQSETPSQNNAETRKIWKATREWRVACVEQALCRSKDGTLRRGELLDVVARTVGWDRKSKMPNAATLLKVVPQNKHNELKSFLHWVNQCYQRNQANIFRLKSGIPTGKGWEQLVFFPRSLSEQKHFEAEIIQQTVYIPSIFLMEKLGPKAILSVRRSPEGHHYFRQFACWRNNPTEENMTTFLDSLTSYTARLRTDYLKTLKEKMVEQLTVTLPTRPLSEKTHWLRMAWKSVESGLNPCITIGEIAWETFQFYRPDKAKTVKEIALGTRKRTTLKFEKLSATKDSGQLTTNPTT
jgi:hypothetical protein